MIHPKKLAPLFLAMALQSMHPLAQAAPQARTAEPTGQAAETTASAPSTQPAPADTASAGTAPPTREQTPKSTSPDTGKNSPFDYRSSEEISEDLPVSFPVDI